MTLHEIPTIYNVYEAHLRSGIQTKTNLPKKLLYVGKHHKKSRYSKKDIYGTTSS